MASGTDPQNVLTTGIHDTMQDTIACLLGAALFVAVELLYYKKKHKGLFMATREVFVQTDAQ